MKDKNDKSTLDPFPKPRRGRPPSANPMTVAQRKKAQRDRNAFHKWDLTNLENVPVTAMLEHLPSLIRDGCFIAVEMICQRLIDAAKSNEPKPE